jgi:glutamate racemase
MNDSPPVFIADTCIGGLSVVNALWRSGRSDDAIFLADYAVNPLGVKSEVAIASVVSRWLGWAEQHSNTLLIACNTLSIRYHQLLQSAAPPSGLQQVVSMVDCFEALVTVEADRLMNRKVLIIGTAFTASQSVYEEILSTAIPGVRVASMAATALEQAIARFEPWESAGNSVLPNELRRAIENTDVVMLACTCFPLVRARLESLFPQVLFLDPGEACADLLSKGTLHQGKTLQLKVTGSVVEPARVTAFARAYLGDGCRVS